MRSMVSSRVMVALVAAVFIASAQGSQVRLEAGVAHPVLKADQKQTSFLKVGLTGFRLEGGQQRPPVNVAIVVDRSGSMFGEKIAKAREAAAMALGRLTYRDTASVVAYNHMVEVLLPATRLSDPQSVRAAIERLDAAGSTALFAGVSKGAEELRKFLDRARANRIILLSDGIANVGPSSPAELGELGASLVKEGISVTTIGLGLGYNEDLMSKLAERSDGNHYFAEKPSDLERVFRNELGDILSVVAQEVLVKIECAPGIRPVRFLGRQGDITGQTACCLLNQLYSEQEKYVLLEIEVPPERDGTVRPVASVEVSYANMLTRATDKLTSSVAVRFSSADALVEGSINKGVMISAVEQIATINSENAVRLRDAGQIEEAKEALRRSARYLIERANELKSDKLRSYGKKQEQDSDNLDEGKWAPTRKGMVEEQSATRSQQDMRK